METVKMRAPNFDQRGLPDFNKDYIMHTYYEEVRVIDGIAYVNNPDSVKLLEAERFAIIKEPEKVVEIPKKRERKGKPKLKAGEKVKPQRRKEKTKRKKRKNPRIIYQD